MYDGTIKKVQDIQVGELLMGDDSTPRSVLSLATGEDEIYKINNYTVNSEHILCLKNENDEIVEIPVNEYLKLSDCERFKLKGYRVSILFKEQDLLDHPYNFGLVIKINASNGIPLEYKSSSIIQRHKLLNGIMHRYGTKLSDKSIILTFENDNLRNDIIYIARSLGYKCIYDKMIIILKKNQNLVYDFNIVSLGRDKYYGFTLDGNSRYVLGDFTVTHNTATAINIYNVLFNYSPRWNVFILIKASLKNDPWLKDLKSWLQSKDKDDRMANIHFIHYDAYNADKAFIEAMKKSDATKKNLYIIDEAHNFIKNVYNNIVGGIGKKAHVIYESIINDKKENDNTRVILLTGTPAVNTPYELALIFNLLRPDIFPKTETKFNEYYIIKQGDNITLNPDNKNVFQRRILGLVSYYIGADPQLFASQKLIMKFLPMDKYQQRVYDYFENIEETIEKKRAMTRSSQKVYNTYTRQASNFVFPILGNEINGENRPRPGKFNLSLNDIDLIARGKQNKLMQSKEEMKLKKEGLNMYITVMNEYVNQLKLFFDKIYNEDKSTGKTIEKDIEIYQTQYKKKYLEFWEGHKDKSKLLTTLHECSCKMTAIPFYIMRSKGPVVIFSNYVKIEGLEILKIYLKYFGYSNYLDENNKTAYKFTEFHGDIEKEQRSKNLQTINLPDNKTGSIIRIILISPAGSEGINLRNIRQVHILDPYWNEVRIKQLIGRAVRMCSHADLPIEERTVDIFRYHAIRAKGDKITTDQNIQQLAFEKENLIDTFLQTIREGAVDCELFKNQNMFEKSYECFKFEEKSLFDKFIGPAYKISHNDEIRYDKKIDNGTNSKNAIKKQIKVVKIKAIKQTDDKKYEPPEFYWYCEESGTVYDFEFDYPIGKILNDNGLPHKIDEDTYIIEDLIPIPILTRV